MYCHHCCFQCIATAAFNVSSLPLLLPMYRRQVIQCNVVAASSNISQCIAAAAATFKLLPPLLLPLYRCRCCFQCITAAAAAPHCIVAAAAAPNISLLLPMYR
eukprot:315571_1